MYRFSTFLIPAERVGSVPSEKIFRVSTPAPPSIWSETLAVVVVPVPAEPMNSSLADVPVRLSAPVVSDLTQHSKTLSPIKELRSN
jgi:hypothetical protein